MISNKGLYQSVDGEIRGSGYLSGSHRLGYVNSAQYDATDTKTIFVGTDDHVAKSADAGCTFTIVYPSAQRGASSKAGRH